MNMHFSALAVTLTLSATSSQAAARDLAGIADFVRPAYIAMNFTVMCAKQDPWFLGDTSGPRGTSLHYAEHVKDEAIDQLNTEEAATVLRLAADAARSVARAKLHELAQSGDDLSAAIAIKLWCDSEGKHFVLEFIRRHDRDHPTAEQFLENAKR